MKKTVAIFVILIVILGIFSFSNKVLATEKAIENKTESKLIEIKETQTKSLEDYKEKYRHDINVFCYICGYKRCNALCHQRK